MKPSQAQVRQLLVSLGLPTDGSWFEAAKAAFSAIPAGTSPFAWEATAAEFLKKHSAFNEAVAAEEVRATEAAVRPERTIFGGSGGDDSDGDDSGGIISEIDGTISGIGDWLGGAVDEFPGALRDAAFSSLAGGFFAPGLAAPIGGGPSERPQGLNPITSAVVGSLRDEPDATDELSLQQQAIDALMSDASIANAAKEGISRSDLEDRVSRTIEKLLADDPDMSLEGILETILEANPLIEVALPGAIPGLVALEDIGGGGASPSKIETQVIDDQTYQVFRDASQNIIRTELMSPQGVSASAQATIDAAATRQALDLKARAEALEENIRQFAATTAATLRRQELDEAKFSVETAQGNTTAALAAAQAITSSSLALASLEAQNVNARNSAAQLTEQINFSAAQAQNTKIFEAAQASAGRVVQLNNTLEQARSRNIDQRIEIARQVADFTRDPGDIVANIAAIDQFGSISTALAGGFTGLSDEALARGGKILGTQDTAVSEGERIATQQAGLQDRLQASLEPDFGVPAPVTPFSFTPEDTVAPTIDFERTFADQLDTKTAATDALTAAATATANRQKFFDQALELEGAGAMPFVQAAGNKEIKRLFGQTGLDELEAQRTAAATAAATEPLMKAEHGGVFSNRVVVGDSSDGKENPEMVEVLPDGRIAVTPIDKIPDDAITMQEGGIVDPNRTRNLLNQFFLPALQRFMQASPGTPLAGGVPTPVGVSAPGTNPDVAAAAGGLAAAGRGVRRDVFERERQAAAATGIRQGVFRRTR